MEIHNRNAHVNHFFKLNSPNNKICSFKPKKPPMMDSADICENSLKISNHPFSRSKFKPTSNIKSRKVGKKIKNLNKINNDKHGRIPFIINSSTPQSKSIQKSIYQSQSKIDTQPSLMTPSPMNLKNKNNHIGKKNLGFFISESLFNASSNSQQHNNNHFNDVTSDRNFSTSYLSKIDNGRLSASNITSDNYSYKNQRISRSKEISYFPKKMKNKGLSSMNKSKMIPSKMKVFHNKTQNKNLSNFTSIKKRHMPKVPTSLFIKPKKNVINHSKPNMYQKRISDNLRTKKYPVNLKQQQSAIISSQKNSNFKSLVLEKNFKIKNRNKIKESKDFMYKSNHANLHKPIHSTFAQNKIFTSTIRRVKNNILKMNPQGKTEYNQSDQFYRFLQNSKKNAIYRK
jgi:hypothetical protein